VFYKTSKNFEGIFKLINERCFAIRVELVCLLSAEILKRRQKQHSSDRFLVEVARKDSSEPTGDSDSITAKQ
jgi:hypothetical protein